MAKSNPFLFVKDADEVLAMLEKWLGGLGGKVMRKRLFSDLPNVADIPAELHSKVSTAVYDFKGATVGVTHASMPTTNTPESVNGSTNAVQLYLDSKGDVDALIAKAQEVGFHFREDFKGAVDVPGLGYIAVLQDTHKQWWHLICPAQA